MNSTFGTPISEAWQTTLRKPKTIENKFMKKNVQNQLLKSFDISNSNAVPVEQRNEKFRVIKFTNQDLIDKLQHLSDAEIETLFFEKREESKIETFENKGKIPIRNGKSYVRVFALIIIAAIFSS
jgi:hypothetical protein